MGYNISWPTDMNGIELSFRDTVHDTAWDCDFSIDYFELRGDLNGPIWYANSGDGNCVNLAICYKVEDENEL